MSVISESQVILMQKLGTHIDILQIFARFYLHMKARPPSKVYQYCLTIIGPGMRSSCSRKIYAVPNPPQLCCSDGKKAGIC